MAWLGCRVGDSARVQAALLPEIAWAAQGSQNSEGGKPTTSGAWHAMSCHWAAGPGSPSTSFLGSVLDLAHCRNAGGWLPICAAVSSLRRQTRMTTCLGQHHSMSARRRATQGVLFAFQIRRTWRPHGDGMNRRTSKGPRLDDWDSRSWLTLIRRP